MAMNWLDPESVREWLAQQGRLSQIEAACACAWAEFGRAVAADVAPSDAGADYCAGRWVVYRQVARLIRDAESGKP